MLREGTQKLISTFRTWQCDTVSRPHEVQSGGTHDVPAIPCEEASNEQVKRPCMSLTSQVQRIIRRNVTWFSASESEEAWSSCVLDPLFLGRLHKVFQISKQVLGQLCKECCDVICIVRDALQKVDKQFSACDHAVTAELHESREPFGSHFRHHVTHGFVLLLNVALPTQFWFGRQGCGPSADLGCRNFASTSLYHAWSRFRMAATWSGIFVTRSVCSLRSFDRSNR